MKGKFKLTAVALAIAALSGNVFADQNISDPDNINVFADSNNGSFGSLNVYKGALGDPTTQLLVTVDDNNNGGTTINTNMAVNGNIAINGGTSTVLTGGNTVAGQDLIIPTVNSAFAGTTQTFNQIRVDTEVGQVRDVATQVYDQNKLQFTAANQVGNIETTTSQSATADYDAAGAIVPGSLSGPVIGPATVGAFTPTTTNSVQDLMLGRASTTEDYALSITKTDGGVTNSTRVDAAGVTTGVITLAGQDLSTTIIDGDAATLASANATAAAGDAATLASANATAAAGDAATLASANATAAAGDAATLASANATAAAGDAATLASANATAAAGDTAIRNDIATKVTTNELEVNGPSTFNGPVTVNNVQSSVVNAQPTVAGKDIVVPTVNQPWANTTQTISSERVDSQEQTRNETKQVYNKDLLQFSSAIVEGTLETTTSQTATATYDANGVIVPGSLQGPTLGQPTSEFKEKSTSSIQEVALGRKDINDDLSLTVTKTANGKTSTSSLSATGISTSRINGNGTNGALVLHGGTNSTTQTLDDNGVTFVTTDAGGMVTGTTTIGADGTLTVKGVDVTQAIDTATTDRAAIRTEFAAADVTLQNNIDAEAATRAAADTAATTDRGAIRSEFAAADTAIRSEMATETVRVNNAIASGDAATLASANANTATTATAIRGEAATEKTRVNGQLAAATTDRAAIRTEFAAADTAIRGEMATETTRVNKAMSDGNSATLASANANTATTATAIRSEMTAGNASTLASANKYTDGRVNQLRSKLDDVEQTAYRGVAIALAAQQAIPNLKPGNVAVFGGVGHYEGETAGALGLATLLGDGRTSLSAALGFAESQIGGRVGVSYVFGD